MEHVYYTVHHTNGLVQDCSISSALAMEILQSCAKPSIHDITCNLIHVITMSAIYRSDYDQTKSTPYLILTGKLWRVFREYRQISNKRRTQSQNINVSCLQVYCSCLCQIHWSTCRVSSHELSQNSLTFPWHFPDHFVVFPDHETYYQHFISALTLILQAIWQITHQT